MSTVVPGGARLSVLKGDARHDRWSDHRAAVRAELVESTVRAIEEYGPDLSIDDVVKTAGIPRPKLYRFFGDKETLFLAASEHIQALVIERVVPHFDLTGTALDLVRSAVAAYVELVDERPNLFRFLVGSHFSDGRSREALLEGGRRLSEATVEVAAAVLSAGGARSENLECAVDAILGAVALGVLRWLNDRPVDKATLVEELTSFAFGAVIAVAAGRGLLIDADAPLLTQSDAH
ncbi:TetR/AcrR family transcriptional regulator [Mycobacterium sp. pUA109]|uniref:TetR/AcrR family transcriptional regulator n=1 Tax=Mycobacterium sp. pUA109 TaxID=3238982 RepID=UPI00351B0E20